MGVFAMDSFIDIFLLTLPMPFVSTLLLKGEGKSLIRARCCSGPETTAVSKKENSDLYCISRRIVSSLPIRFTSPLIYPSAFIAGLNNTIIQLVYLARPSLAESGSGANFFQGTFSLSFPFFNQLFFNHLFNPPSYFQPFFPFSKVQTFSTSLSNQGSSLLFSDWSAIEIGVGLIACNLPSLSFGATRRTPPQL